MVYENGTMCEIRGTRRQATEKIVSSQPMTMMFLLNRIGPNYLFIHRSTACDEKKNGSVMIGGVCLRSDMNGSE